MKTNKLWEAKKIKDRKINLHITQMNVMCVNLTTWLGPS
jgi:hypothetical protein